MQEAKENAGKTYAEKLGNNYYKYTLNKSLQRNERFTVADDDELKSKKWAALMTDVSHYFDAPSLEQERKMKFTLQRKYDDLFGAGWRPHLQSRKDLVNWACNSQNEFLSSKNVPEDQLLNCNNYDALLQKYGPNYDAVKAKLGFIAGLFDE